MKRVLQPVELSKCICTVGEERREVVFLTITADDIGLVCTHPPASNGEAVLQLQVSEGPEGLPDFVQNYLMNRFNTEKTKVRKRKADQVHPVAGDISETDPDKRQRTDDKAKEQQTEQ
eukprot:GILK01016059.1.p1 GENE.GILK01016059.1~~GILK01016059.1.p1  ORF type:complete len:118 (-),score=19.13 GILK01016059.1:92-445(-)